MAMLYSPFFTSGLLNGHTREDQAPRRGSLPTDPAAPHPQSPTSTSAYYSGMQPRRDPTQLRSFLSLDLAESHAASSSHSHSQSHSYSISPSLLAPPPPVLSLRRSRDSLRSIPSPKPVPSASLPAIPTLPAAAHPHPQTQSAPASPTHRGPLPPLPPIARAPRLSLVSFRLPWHTPRSPVSPASASKRASIPATIARTVSIASTTRRARRADALASLEGRPRPKTAPSSSTSTRAPHPHTHTEPHAHTRSSRNFMDMSDEEDGWGAADPAPLPMPPSRASSSFITSPTFTSRASYASRPESAVPAPAFHLAAPPAPSRTHSHSHIHIAAKAQAQKRRSTLGFALPAPLASFIDLADDNERGSWNWRSFVQVDTR